MNYEGYHASRFQHDPRRSVLWQTLWNAHFSREIAPDFCVLELGCGYGEFINSVVARRRIGLDMWEGMRNYLQDGVEPIIGSATDLSMLEDGCVDYVFASNLFEHLTQDQFRSTLAAIRPKLTSRGTLTILQPNYRYAYREYFDDYTHLSIYSHIGICDFLRSNAYEVTSVQPRFLPLSIKSKLPVSPTLIKLYLASPLRPLGKQMLVTARPCAGRG
jgi:SAM-dependent methyltransferase